MKISSFLTINSVIVFLFGLGLVIVPETLMSLYGVELTGIGKAISQLLGAAFLGFGVLRFLARTSEDKGFLKAVVVSGFIEDSLGFVVLLVAQLDGLTNASGWSNVILYGLFALGFGVFHFQRDA
jgi:hypothetical protein